MTTADSPISSFGQLAGRCLDHEQWPGHIALKYRSLSTLFSKLDRDKDLDWLRDRIEVQQILAELLGRPLGDIRSSIGETPNFNNSRFLRFVDVRYARELDLTREELPPGIPRQAWDPPSWEPTWWHAPPGSGRSLTAAWLRARGLAHTHVVTSREDLEEAPPRGPLFVEIASHVAPDALDLKEEDYQSLRAFRRPLCIAASFGPPRSRPESRKFKVITAEPPASYIPELIDWVAERLDETGEFRPDRVETWMLKVAIPAGAVQTWGDALGLMGMADEVPLRSLLAKSLDELGVHFVERRLREVSEHQKLTPKQIGSAFDALKQCAARVLVTGENTLEASHPLDEWTALLSAPQGEDSPDPEWFTAALRGALGAQVSRRDLLRAARKLPPSSFQLTRGLEAARLLVRDPNTLARDESGAERTLHPRWLVSLLTSRAAQEVLYLTPSQWGRVLLVGRDADRIIHGLSHAARRDQFEAIFNLVEDYEADDAAHSAALEGSVIALGLSFLEGLEVPDELIEGVFAHLAEEVLVIDRLVEPRLTFDHPEVKLFSRAAFLVSFAALCQEVPFPLEHLDPVRSKAPRLRAHFAEAFQRLSSETWPSVKVRCGLLRCLEAISPPEAAAESHLRFPALEVLRNFESAPPALFQEALASFPAEALVQRAMQRGLGEGAAHRALWRYAVALRAPGSLFLEEETERSFWRHIPHAHLAHRVKNNLAIPWHHLLPHQYAEWFSHEDAPPLPEAAAAHVPIDSTLTVIEQRGTSVLSDAALSIFSARGSGGLSQLVGKWCRSGNEVAVARVLARVPAATTAIYCRALPSSDVLLQGKANILHHVRTFLMKAVRKRHPGYQECFDVLRTIERGVGPLRQLP